MHLLYMDYALTMHLHKLLYHLYICYSKIPNTKHAVRLSKC